MCPVTEVPGQPPPVARGLRGGHEAVVALLRVHVVVVHRVVRGDVGVLHPRLRGHQRSADIQNVKTTQKRFFVSM